MTDTTSLERGPRRTSAWPAPVALAVLSATPLIAGGLRLVQLAGGPAVIPADDRFAGLPFALVTHILGSAVFALVGVLQFVPTFRRRHWSWHRRAGRALTIAGLAVAGSGLWLTLGYAPHPGTGPVLFVARLLAGSTMAGCLILGITAIRRRDITAHRAWMMRAYALALGAGTQVITEGFGELLLGTGALRGDLYKLGGWVINLAVAEWVIRGGRANRPAVRSSDPRAVASSSATVPNTTKSNQRQPNV